MLGSLRTVTAIAAVSTACVSLRVAPVGSVDAELMLAGTPVARVGLEAPTASFALDRITRRAAQLTGKVRRTGTGSGVAIYVFDGGIADHPELAGRVRVGYDAFPGTPRVCNPHGLAVAAAAAGSTLGVAPDAEIVDVKIINCEPGHGSVDAILAAARWTAEDHRLHPEQPAVANWSFVVDTSRNVAAIDTAVAVLREAGILVVVSAGNLDIDACRVSPANSPGALVVGAASLAGMRDGPKNVALHDVRTPNTAWGACVDVYAPGEDVPLPSVERGKGIIARWTGTSMAAGYVSGAASLVLERFQSASPDDVMRILRKRATANAVDEMTDTTGTLQKARKPLLYAGPG